LRYFYLKNVFNRFIKFLLERYYKYDVNPKTTVMEVELAVLVLTLRRFNAVVTEICFKKLVAEERLPDDSLMTGMIENHSIYRRNYLVAIFYFDFKSLSY